MRFMSEITYAITYAFSEGDFVSRLLMRFQITYAITYAFSEGEHKVPRLLMRFISEFTRSCTLANLDN
jgi:hypothetical protein